MKSKKTRMKSLISGVDILLAVVGICLGFAMGGGNVHAAEYFSDADSSSKAACVVTNGGSPTYHDTVMAAFKDVSDGISAGSDAAP